MVFRLGVDLSPIIHKKTKIERLEIIGSEPVDYTAIDPVYMAAIEANRWLAKIH
ncbi:hypothetical protein [Chamaesiphon polymorphus]|uniref:hypothetical protein n=1 Tax=Chamaesiphon polymorphus TaxID=2107691 RepID=UPI0015E63A6E|nr:hypothetical protein [Chamaesiphon polymorphus]